MNRSFIGGSSIRNAGLSSSSSSSASHRRGHSTNGVGGAILSSDDNLQLDLFSRSRRSLSIASSDDSEDVSVAARLGRLSLGSKTTSAAKLTKNPLDDLLASTDGGKHDYDWLLTPPGTPIFPTSDGNGSETVGLAARNSSLARSTSTSTMTKTSRLSVSQSSETNNRPRPTRSSSVTRPSVSTSQYSTYSSNKSSSILNTSSASVSSYIRPSTPGRSSSTAARPSTPSSRPTLSRSSTPSKSRPTASTYTSAEKVMRPSQNSRPSTPTSRSQIPANLNTPVSRSTSRPSTPTRRNPAPPSSSLASGPPNLASRSVQNGRALVATSSRPSSPGPRVRPTPQPIVLPDFPLETPPNLRTTLPDRPLSAGRSRPGSAASSRGNTENQGVVTLQRRNSSPVVSRGRLPETPARNKLVVNGHPSHNPESHRSNSDLSTRKPLKTSTDSTGFGRTISKKSLDMAMRHMDIRNGSNGIRPLSSSTLFPQSIRSAGNTTKVQQNPPVSAVEAASYNDGDITVNNHYGTTATAEQHGNFVSKYHMENNGNDQEAKKQQQPQQRLSAKLSVADIYESSRYDTLLLKEDLKNTNWLHSLDDKFGDEGALFDNGFEPLPEPFDPL
ncbi:OLC1v1033516C1 [Oldenlandia corymbosa var. corymbosa]|uniref:OLC1v1033516C1 n=1 Tax=Oldenlandia corymbosa var. corymbosa TaxID=529605 RepID=A0AAV1CPQ2_OLDCO|nr:OLC1v1033516C1 [Oldenlandia corymbosa var. corymbosa]